MKLMVFDIDGTLSDHGTPIPHHVAMDLVTLENKGIGIALCSGKPAFYLAGLARGMGLKKAKLIGENGCVIFDDETLEETRLAKRIPALEEIENKVVEHFNDDIWIQPNRVALTIFPKKQSEIPLIANFIRQMLVPIEKEVVMYEHIDAVDIIPVGVDKGLALKKLTNELLIDKQNILAFGDSTNDLPMFREAGQVVIIGNRIEFQNAVIFSSINEALHSTVVKNFIK